MQMIFENVKCQFEIYVVSLKKICDLSEAKSSAESLEQIVALYGIVWIQRWNEMSLTETKQSQSPSNSATDLHLSQAMRKCVLCHMQTTKAQISLRIPAVWSAPLLFAA